MATINKIISLSFDMDELSNDFINKWESDIDGLDDEFRDNIPVKHVCNKFFKALCDELNIHSTYKRDEITHIQSIF